MYDDIICMSNVLGKLVKVPGPLPFSFYFSLNVGEHSIRVKPAFNPERIKKDQLGTLKLSDDWEYIPGKDDRRADSKEIRRMKTFFRKYKVLFAAVWEEELEGKYVEQYFEGSRTLQELITAFDKYAEWGDALDDIQSIEELEQTVRDNKLFNMND